MQALLSKELTSVPFKNIITSVYTGVKPLEKKIKFSRKIRLDAFDKKIYSNTETKTFQYTFNKRIVDYENSTSDRLTTRPIIVQ